jgi:hypothetical protein
MIKNFLFSKIASAAAGECFVVGIKLADTEAHLIRIFGFLLFLASAIIMFVEWNHKAHAETVSIPVITVPTNGKRSRKNSRSRASRTR